MNSPPKLRWYVAVLVLESSIDDGESDPSVDVQFRLIHASDAEAAYERAQALGREAEHSYENCYGQTCTWSFKGLEDLREVLADELGDGVEVYGFIRDEASEGRVIPKMQLTVFGGGAVGDDSHPPGRTE